VGINKKIANSSEKKDCLCALSTQLRNGWYRGTASVG